ncbi:DUF1036 domain-containing protein [Jannaschia marina]|uniref:DUF1036 domain-containing protein n=1 Tax=Jannaschia marina TaxID=2741674 RepID=UPI0015CBCF23|nr:DUF1036 domain-containing protein [Jannaschia marina]
MAASLARSGPRGRGEGRIGTRRCGRAALAGAFAFLWAGAAEASFTICNRSFDVANVAIGTEADGRMTTQGWWKIGPNQCAEAIPDALAPGTVYVFALDVFGRELLSGAVPLCVAPARFRISDAREDCAIRGHLDARFLAVDTGEARAWRMFIAPLPE